MENCEENLSCPEGWGEVFAFHRFACNTVRVTKMILWTVAMVVSHGAPQKGLSFAICLIRLIYACGVFGLPLLCLLFHLQYDLKPCRCHRITVSGLMISNVPFQDLRIFVGMP
jgi:predicted permease